MTVDGHERRMVRWTILECLSRPALLEAATTFCAGLISISRATSHSNGSADGTLAGHPHGGPTVRKPTSGSHVCTTGFALHEAGQRCPYTAWRPVNPQPYGRSARRRICHLTPVSPCSCYGAAPTRCRNGPGPRKLNGHGTGSASDTGARSGQGATAESPTYSSEGISGR